MKDPIFTASEKVQRGEPVTEQEALELYDAPLCALCQAADDIRRQFCGSRFDLCAIINGKSGRCSEDCAFCAQSARHHTGADTYSLLPTEEIVAQARISERQGVPRFSVVTSGKRLSEREVDRMCEAVRSVRKETGLSVCVSFGLLNEAQYRKLKDAGVTRVHNNLETSERYFPHICTTHRFSDKTAAIRAAQRAGLSVCSGGIIGLGETRKDRVDLALSLRELCIKSVPINLLNPIPGTPLADRSPLPEEELRRTVAVFRFLLPDAFLRLAGGRELLPDRGRGCLLSGANAAISGDMLTTAGVTVQTDLALLHELGYEVRCEHA